MVEDFLFKIYMTTKDLTVNYNLMHVPYATKYIPLDLTSDTRKTKQSSSLPVFFGEQNFEKNWLL